MTAIWFALGDFFQLFFPVFKAIGGIYNAFWMLLIFAGICGWVAYMAKHPDRVEKFD